MVSPAEPLVARDAELERLDGLLDGVSAGVPRIAALIGEPGIGKTRLLSELARRADSRGYVVLEGRSLEFERDLPFSVFVDACDEYLAALDGHAVARIAGEGLAELTGIFPSLESLALPGTESRLVDERYRAHRAVRQLCEGLAMRRPLLLALDDVQWADEASIELLAHLVRRPPAAGVVVALAYRSGRLPVRLAEAVELAAREHRLDQFELRPLNRAEAAVLLERVDPAVREALIRESGGNPFYLQQLARAPAGARAADHAAPLTLGGDLDLPDAVAESIGRQLGALSELTRTLLQAAAVSGDPFEPDVASEIAGESEQQALDAIDEGVALGLVRATEIPRRFAFRHPIVRRALYELASPGWRLGAHARAAAALAARGAPLPERAHHVEHAARRGDAEAVGLLREAGRMLEARAPAAAARWFAAALRLLPGHGAGAEVRVELLMSVAQALAATGRLVQSRATLLELLELLPEEGEPRRARVTAACAGLEHMLGHHDDAHRRLLAALERLPDQASPEGVALMIELAVDAFYVVDYERMREWGSRALEAAVAVGDSPLSASAEAVAGWGCVVAGDAENAGRHCAATAMRVFELSDEQVAQRIDALNHLGWAEHFIGRFHESLANFDRGLAVSHSTAQGQFLLQLREGRANNLAAMGRLSEAMAATEESIEAARLSGTTQALSWMLGGMCLWATYAGDLDAARRAGEESMELIGRLDRNALTVVSTLDYAAYLVEAGEPGRAIELAVASARGPELPLDAPAWTPFHYEILTRAALAAGSQRDAELFAARAGEVAARLGWPVAMSQAQRARAVALLGAGELTAAAGAALEAAALADGTGARLDEARARLLAGRALAAAGEPGRAQAELRSSERMLHECGALRWRDEAGRELRKLGARVERRRRGGQTAEKGVASLSDREREVAELVRDRKTNPEIAGELYLSKKTVETHLRNIFRKLDAASRVDVARAMEREAGSERPRR
jgi:DNA-binding CsgD family transcriptional regulator